MKDDVSLEKVMGTIKIGLRRTQTLLHLRC